MARLSKDSPLQGLRGQVGRELVFKRYGAKTVVSRFPDMSGVVATAGQLAGRERFRRAVRYAQAVLHDPGLYAYYLKRLQPGQPVYHEAKKAYLNCKPGEESSLPGADWVPAF